MQVLDTDQFKDAGREKVSQTYILLVLFVRFFFLYKLAVLRTADFLIRILKHYFKEVSFLKLLHIYFQYGTDRPVWEQM